MITCQNCGNEIFSDMIFCPKCGNKLETICPSCKHINSAGVIYCVKCGTKLRNSLEIGDIINFGNYYINNNQIKEPIEWRVLEVSDNKALLITKDAIDCKLYNKEMVDITWEECTLRKWLNNEFINEAFTKEEQNEILVTILSNPDNYEYGTKGGNKTRDKIFLLSIDEANKYFKNDKDRECKPTKYAKECGAETSDDSEYKETCFWWLRSPGNYQFRTAVVDSDGGIGDLGDDIDRNNDAVRPALFINL